MVRELASAVLVAVLANATPASAQADDESAAAGFARGQAELGAHAAYASGEACYRDYDLIACTSGMAFAGVQAAVHYRLTPFWSFGLGGLLDGGGAAPGDSALFWLAEPQARFHPLGKYPIDPSIGVGGGLIAVKSSTGTKTAPELGVRFAVDFPLSRSLLLGPELWGFLLLFAENAEVPPDKTQRYATQRGIALAVRATLRFADGPP
jgi:hypothetical protein